MRLKEMEMMEELRESIARTEGLRTETEGPVRGPVRESSVLHCWRWVLLMNSSFTSFPVRFILLLTSRIALAIQRHVQ